jgi:hypothetical protein
MIFIIVPWVLTIAALVLIMVRGRKNTDKGFDQFMEEEPEQESFSAAIYGDRAYWVLGNVFYESGVNREPDFSTAHPVDTMAMPPQQLEYLLKVLDDLEKHEKEKQ